MGAGLRWPGSDLVTRATRAATAIQVGEPERIADLAGELEASTGFGDDARVMLAMFSLQQGDLVGAARHLGGPDDQATNPNLVSTQALYAAAAGTGEAGALADRVRRPARRHLPRSGAGRGGRRASRRRRPATVPMPPSASPRLDRWWPPRATWWLAAVVELAGAEVAQRTGDPDAPHQRVEADRRFANLGIDPAGWVRIIELTASAVPA